MGFICGFSVSAQAADDNTCTEVAAVHQLEWTDLSVHTAIQSRKCHSRLSDTLKAQGGSNERLSHAVYHQILAGEGFRNIPLWPDKHKDWVGGYEGYDYVEVFLPALQAAENSWDAGFEGGVKHDFAIGWTHTVTEDDFWINEYRNRTGRLTGFKSYFVLPGLFLFLLVLIESLIHRLGWLPGWRFFYPYKSTKNSRLFELRKPLNLNTSPHKAEGKTVRGTKTFMRALPIAIPIAFLGSISGYLIARKVNFNNAMEFTIFGLALGLFLGFAIGVLKQK